MEEKRQCYWWWFDSHNSAKGSPWLQSTLTELNEKTTSMLKLIEEDADSFAQRAEMYYKKRPELIAMVEDFYRAHRSLAERYDQLRHHTSSAHPKSPLRLSLPLPKGKCDDILLNSSVKPFDSSTDGGYYSEESEIHDPEEDYTRFDQHIIEEKTEDPFHVEESYDELMKLREELDRLREENEFQRKLIEQKAEENEECLMKLTGEIERLKVQNMSMIEELKQKDVEKMEAKRQFHEAKHESIKVREAMQGENRRIKEALVEKDEEKREVIRQLSSAMEMLREENRVLRYSIVKKGPKKCGEVQNFKGIKLGK